MALAPSVDFFEVAFDVFPNRNNGAEDRTVRPRLVSADDCRSEFCFLSDKDNEGCSGATLRPEVRCRTVGALCLQAICHF